MKWQVRHGKEVRYFEPQDFGLRMVNCILKNKPSDAERIYTGENKRVCAWINCESVEIYYWDVSNTHTQDDSMVLETSSEQIRYNPRVAPYWSDSDGNNIDNQHVDLITSDGRSLYAEPIIR